MQRKPSEFWRSCCQWPHLCPEDSCVCLHGLLQLAADLGHTQAALGVAQLVQALYCVGASIRRQVRLGGPRLALLSCSTHTRAMRCR